MESLCNENAKSLQQSQHSSTFMWLIEQLKVIYSEKATKCCEISTNYLSDVLPVKQLVEILQNFVAFSEHMNFNMYKFAISVTVAFHHESTFVCKKDMFSA